MKVLYHVPVKPTYNLFLFFTIFLIFSSEIMLYKPQQILLDKIVISFMKLAMPVKKTLRKNLAREKSLFFLQQDYPPITNSQFTKKSIEVTRYFSNRSDSHQDTKTQRIDMAFTPLSEKEEHIARKTVDAVPIASGYMMVQYLTKEDGSIFQQKSLLFVN